jgi:hypothetical protein
MTPGGTCSARALKTNQNRSIVPRAITNVEDLIFEVRELAEPIVDAQKVRVTESHVEVQSTG